MHRTDLSLKRQQLLYNESFPPNDFSFCIFYGDWSIDIKKNTPMREALIMRAKARCKMVSASSINVKPICVLGAQEPFHQ